VKKKRFSVEQIVAVRKQAEVGVPVVEVCRQVGISEQTFYRWRKKVVGLEIDQVRQLKQLQEENGKLKKLMAELSLDKAMRQDVLAKNSKALLPPSRSALPAWCVSSESAARPAAPHSSRNRLIATGAGASRERIFGNGFERSPRCAWATATARSGCWRWTSRGIIRECASTFSRPGSRPITPRGIIQWDAEDRVSGCAQVQLPGRSERDHRSLATRI
jgi:putative transposase